MIQERTLAKHIVKYEVLELANKYSSEEERDVSSIVKAIEMETNKIHEEPVAENVFMTTEVVMENSIEVETVKERISMRKKMYKLCPKARYK